MGGHLVKFSDIGDRLVALGLIAAVTVLSLNGKPVTDLLGLVGIGILPILGLAVNAKLNGIQSTSDAVQKQTNGTQTQLVNALQEAQRMIADLKTVHAEEIRTHSGSDPEV